MLTAMTSAGQIIQFPADFHQELDDAPEEKQLEILPRKMAEFFAILATSALPNDSVETEGPYMGSCGVDVAFHLIDSCDIGTFYTYNFDHAKIYINSLKRLVERYKGPAESPMEVTIGEPYPLTEEQAVQHAQDICNRRFVVDKEKGSFIGTYRPSTDSDPSHRPNMHDCPSGRLRPAGGATVEADSAEEAKDQALVNEMKGQSSEADWDVHEVVDSVRAGGNPEEAKDAAQEAA